MKKPALRDLKTIQPEHPVLCTGVNGRYVSPKVHCESIGGKTKKEVENGFDNVYGYFPIESELKRRP